MRARLDEKVDRLRSQVMQFASDGIQVSLNIPDTGDVKETFGSVINTVVEQQDEIQDLNINLEASSAQNAEAQKKLLAWTASCVIRLKEDNERLQLRLADSHKQIKNLSYNMQGFIDQEAADDAEAEVQSIEFDELPKLSEKTLKVADHSSSLFPTEEGGVVDEGGMGFVAPTPQVHKVAKYKDEETKEQAKALYLSTPANTIPSELHARWRWAIRKVMGQIRRKKAKTGLTRTRVEPQQTFAGRLDRVEAVMFNMQTDFKGQLADMHKKVNHRIDTTAERIGREVSAAADKLDSLTEEVKHRFTGVQEEIAQVDTTMREFFEKAKEQSSGDSKAIKDTLQVLETHAKDLLRLQLDGLRSHMGHITAELDQMEVSADQLMEKITISHTVSTTLPKFDLARPLEESVSELTDLLQVDAQLREARQEVASLETSLVAIGRNYNTVSQQVAAVHQHYNKESVRTAAVEMILPSQLEDLAELGQHCLGADTHMKHVSALLSALNRMCLEHDKVVKERMPVFNSLSKSLRDIATESKELFAFKEYAMGKLDASPVDSPMRSAGPSKEMLELLEKFERDLGDLNFRVGMMEEMGEEGFEEEEPAAVVEEPVEEDNYLEPIITESRKATLTYDDPPSPVPAENEEEEGHAVVQPQPPAASSVDVMSDTSYKTSTIQLSDPAGGAAERVVVVDGGQTPSAPVSAEASGDAEDGSIAPAPVGIDSAKQSAVQITTPAAASMPTKNTDTGLIAASYGSSKPPKGGVRPSGGSGGGGLRKAAASGGLDAIEARMRPLIEKLVAASVEARMLALGGGMGMGEEDDEHEDEDDDFASTPNPLPLLLSPDCADNDGSEPPAGGGVSPTLLSGSGAAPPFESTSRTPSIFSRSRQGSADMSAPVVPRIRREFSRFGGNDASSKMRTGKSSKSGKLNSSDLSPYIEELAHLKKENNRLSKSVAKLDEDRCSKDDVERLFQVMIHNFQQNEQKEESNHALHSMERRVDTLTKELGLMRAQHLKAVADLQSEFSETLYRVVSSAAETMDADNKEAFVSTRALCLGCGRNSMVRASAESRPTSPSFFPQLSNHSLQGPDVMRGGFKLPVKNPLNPNYVLEGSTSPNKPRGVKSAGQRMQEAILAGSLNGDLQPGSTTSNVYGSSLELEAVLPRVRTAQPRPHTSHHTVPQGGMDGGDLDDHSANEEELNQFINAGSLLEENSQVTMERDGSLIIQANKGYQLNIHSSTAPMRETSALKVVRGSQSRPEAQETRPMYRKGFPGKKSMRAETTYAHERYDLDLPNSILLGNTGKVSNAALVPGSEGIGRPYSSQEASRPSRQLLSNIGNNNARLSSTMNVSASNTRF